MSNERRDQLLAAILWGAVAAMGQYTALFLSIIGRIHVSFVNQAPIFRVAPSAVPLTKDLALQLVWALTIAFGLLAAGVVYRRPRPGKRSWVVLTLSVLLVSIAAGLIEPVWAGVVWLDYLALLPALCETPAMLRRLL